MAITTANDAAPTVVTKPMLEQPPPRWAMGVLAVGVAVPFLGAAGGGAGWRGAGVCPGWTYPSRWCFIWCRGSGRLWVSTTTSSKAPSRPAGG
jgi:hypothetical protein